MGLLKVKPTAVAEIKAPVPTAPAADPRGSVEARLLAAYPRLAVDIAQGFTAVGEVIVSSEPVKVPGGWGTKRVGAHQKYRLSNGTIVCLDA